MMTYLYHLTRTNLVLLALFAFLLFAGCAYALDNNTAEPRPAHHTADGFKNPYAEKKKRGFFKYLKMRYFSSEEFADYDSNAYKISRVETDLDLIQNPPDTLQVTWIGHATMLVQYRGINILTDPMFSDRASPISFLGPKRYNPSSVKLKDLPKIDYIVISHSHYDHLDKKTVQQIGSDTIWLVPLGLQKWFVNAGIEENSVVEFDWWDVKKFGNLTITATPAQHWSARSLWDRNKTLWASWMLQIDDKTIWYSGDTGYNPYQFNEIGREFKTIDLALISIGAYEPRWFMKEMHINPAEAVQIHQDIKSQHSIAVQWGTFQLTSEPIDDPPLKLKEALARERIPSQEFELLKIGETRGIH
ncbi:MBL fold metallo-hydrolase [Thermodesulfobacteriota bacterium]